MTSGYTTRQLRIVIIPTQITHTLFNIDCLFIVQLTLQPAFKSDNHILWSKLNAQSIGLLESLIERLE